ncbi:hypothetical protein B0T26DRAFT_521402 [Lasiosphaeria miniovina]|uniref:Uncharacterized protein n=1 Tax=Lasiosphaeria miniovina TaxID=1954250 RepID=A0AA39ZUX4_9PEZI|nr:uncharacterized protein B0T26DRAFT_521402 [Lasiosphaeria miniovina]KAK0704033.1 hypothetical protein B0T26DRAFT_521402 [Lasiosphaeria miniovina]
MQERMAWPIMVMVVVVVVLKCSVAREIERAAAWTKMVVSACARSEVDEFKEPAAVGAVLVVNDGNHAVILAAVDAFAIYVPSVNGARVSLAAELALVPAGICGLLPGAHVGCLVVMACFSSILWRLRAGGDEAVDGRE